MELKDLVGPHMLDAVDFGVVPGSGYNFDEDVNTIRFRLDGVVYTAVEDPEDGYRSMLSEIAVEDRAMKNVFPPQSVVARMEDCEDSDILEIVDAVTKKTVLRVGTADCNDYYPCFISEYTPENMEINQGRGGN